MPWSQKHLPDAIKNKDWSAHQIATFIAAANAALEEYDDDGKAIATGIAAAEKEKKNARQVPKTYYCRHMQPGTARYEDETILVDTDGMKNMINSVGTKSIPVYVLHQDVDLKNIKEQADGYVTESFYNSLDGWAWFKFLVVDDKGHDAIKKNWRVSNAYVPTEFGPKGTKNNVPYNREFRNGEFTHLAIVPDPRYEGALIYTPDEFNKYQDGLRKKVELKNSKEKKSMFKFFKTTETTDAPTDDTLVDIGDGVLKPWKEVKNALEEADKNQAAKVTINGKEMTLEEAAEKFRAIENAKKKKNTKKNGESKMKEDPDEEDTEGDQEDEGDDEVGEANKNAGKKNGKKAMKKNKKEEDEEEDCMNSDDEEDEEDTEKKNKKAKKNSVVDLDKDDNFFKEMRNAHLNVANAPVAPVSSSIDQLERGKARYGSGSK